MAYVPEFRVGETLSRAVGMFWRNLLPLGGCIAVVSIIGIIAQVIATVAFNAGRMTGQDDTSSPISVVVTLVITLLTSSFASAVNGHAARCELQGQKASFGSGWDAGWRNLFPQMGLLLLLWLMLFLGWSFFAVPGMILGVLFGLAPAAQVVEGKGVFAAFGDSLKAGEGNRWALFGYYLAAYGLCLAAIVVLYLVLALAGIGAIAGAGAGAGVSEGSEPSGGVILAIILIGLPLYIFLIGAIPLALGSIPAAAYVSLRKDRSERAVSSVFD